MRQKLPEDGYGPLLVADGPLEVHPGDEFDAPHLVPGCVPLEPPSPGPRGAQQAPDDVPLVVDPPDPAEAATEPQDTAEGTAGDTDRDPPAGPARAPRTRAKGTTR